MIALAEPRKRHGVTVFRPIRQAERLVTGLVVVLHLRQAVSYDNCLRKQDLRLKLDADKLPLLVFPFGLLGGGGERLGRNRSKENHTCTTVRQCKLNEICMWQASARYAKM